MRFSPEEVVAEIRRQAPVFGVKPEFATALFMAENSADGDVNSPVRGDAVSRAQARGVMQVIPQTAEGLRKAGFLPPDWKHDPANLSSQVAAGLAAIKEKTSRMRNPDDPIELGVIYNGSTKTHKNYLSGGPLPTETAQYLVKVRNALSRMGIQLPGANMEQVQEPIAGGMTSNQVDQRMKTTVSAGGSNSNTVTTRRNINDPAMMALYSDSVMNFAAPGGAADQAANAIIAGGEQRQQLMSTLTQAITDKATAAGMEAAAISAYDAKQAARRAEILQRLNLHPDQTNNRMLQAASIIDQTDSALIPLKAEIDSRMAVGFFDNPFQWLVNQTVLPGIVAKYNGIVGQQKNAISTYKTLENIATTNQQLTSSIDADEILKKGVAIKQKVAADATAEATKAQIQVQDATLRDAATIATLSGQKVSAIGGVVRAKQDSQTISDTAMQRASAKQEVAEIKKREEASKNEELQAVNNMLRMAGATPMPSYEVFSKLPAKAREELLNTARSGKFGENLAEAAKFINDRGNIANLVNSGDAAMVDWLRKASAEASKRAEDERAIAVKQGKKIDSKVRFLEILNEIQQKYEAQAATDMRTADDSNPFKIDYVKAAQIPELQGNVIAAYIREKGPGSKEPLFSKVDEVHLLSRIAAAVANGKLKMPDAVNQVNTFYKVASRQQIMWTKPTLMGFTVPEKTYAVNLPSPGIIGGIKNFFGNQLDTPGMKLDLGNPAQVENFLTRTIAKEELRRRLATPGEGVPEAMFDPLGLLKKEIK